jgi:hypothetical protein
LKIHNNGGKRRPKPHGRAKASTGGKSALSGQHSFCACVLARWVEAEAALEKEKPAPQSNEDQP